MNLLFYTNIILSILRAQDYQGIISFLNPEDAPVYISIASEAEIKSLAIRNKWGTNRKKMLDTFLDQLTIVEINQLYINIYAEIDTYSQRENPSFSSYAFKTPRNMGKNDLWIASLAALLGLQLITTDADFDYLHQVFFKVRKITFSDINIYF